MKYLITKEYDPDTEKIISFAAQAHNILEMVFESSITDKTRDFMEIEK